MAYSGNLSKMKVSLTDPIQYHLQLGDDLISMNELIGQDIHLKYSGIINCKICGRKIKKAYGEGLCYPDFLNHPGNSPCILKPELCEGHLGNGRDLAWEEANHVQPHIVYLALTDAVKVGVTRGTQVPTRWIDQGAWKTIQLAEVPYRQLAGEIEVNLKEYVTDRTNWRSMLRDIRAEGKDLLAEKDRLIPKLPIALQAYRSEQDKIWELNYPVLAYGEKVSSLNFDKIPEISGKLMGIRGQYLLLEGGKVLNLRKHTGYHIELS